jgi:biotin carboxylase
MIIGAGILQVPLIKICKKNGYEVIATDKNRDSIGFKYADRTIVVDGTDKENILEYAKKFNIDGIVTTSEFTLFSVAYVCEKLGLKGPSRKAAQISNDKYLMRKCMSESGIESPKYWLIHNAIELNRIENEVRFPVVVKPVDASSSLGVIKANSINEIKSIFDEVLKNSRNNKIIIEEFLDGPEFSVETLSQHGIHNIIDITEKSVLGYPYFVEQRHIIPANINKEQKQEISKMVIRLLDACEFNNCAGHTEIKLTKDGPRIIETGARIGGDYITSDLVPLATGISIH